MLFAKSKEKALLDDINQVVKGAICKNCLALGLILQPVGGAYQMYG